MKAKLGYELEIGIDLQKIEYGTERSIYENDNGDMECESCGNYADDCECSGEGKIICEDITSLGFEIAEDGSISTNENLTECVELRSPIYSLEENGKEKIINDFKAIQKYFKDSNDTMGLHFHISFTGDDTNYLKLCSWEFVSKFQQEYLNNFEYERESKRINNQYCKFFISEDDFKEKVIRQQKNDHNARYTSVNYKSFAKTRTIEFRIFPSTKYYTRFEKYLTFTLDLIEEYLKNAKLPQISRSRELDKKEIEEIREIKDSVEKDAGELIVCVE